LGSGGRFIWAAISTAFTYFLYIYLPNYLLTFIKGASTGTGFVLSVAKIEIGNFDDLVFYINSLGYIIMGLTFAQGMAHKKTPIKHVWALIKLFLAIFFWALFLFVEFNMIDVTATLGGGISLALGIDLTIMFYVMIGGNIFSFITTILDILIAKYVKDDEEKEEEM
jgi:hypothetical protein